MSLSHSSLHYAIVKQMVDEGRAPKIAELCDVFEVTAQTMIEALQALQDYHGVVLHPASSEVWVIHPFSTAPTNFWIEADDGGWWGNCAWCSLGAAALLDRDVTITTTLGGESRQLAIEVTNGQIANDNLYIHFPVPMVKAWDNVAYTCSTMLMFESEADIDDWCERHAVPRGDVQDIANIWEFSKVWYGNHLNPAWEKWSVDEASEIFRRFNLGGPIWELPSGEDRF